MENLKSMKKGTTKGKPTPKSTLVSASDPFLTEDAAKEYSSLACLEEDGLPRYLRHYKAFTDQVINIPQEVLDDITKFIQKSIGSEITLRTWVEQFFIDCKMTNTDYPTHVEREMHFKETENQEEEAKRLQMEQEEKLQMSKDKKLYSIIDKKRFYVKRVCPVKIPFKSTLNHEEHEFYVKCFLKFRQGAPKTSIEQAEYNQYISMQNRVFDEQTCLMNFSYKACQLLLKEYNSVKPLVDEHIKVYYSHKKERAFCYPNIYRSEIEIPLRPQLPEGKATNFELKHLGHLMSMGDVPWLFLPKPKTRVIFDMTNKEKIKIKKPDSDYEFNRDAYLYKTPVSEDPNAEYLASTHGAKVVMSASTFKVIADNQEQPFDREWYIPVTIRACKHTDEDGKSRESRIVFLDKPLPKKTWLPLQKKSTFFKASALARLTNVKKPYKLYYQAKENKYNKTRSIERHDIPSWFSDTDTDMESFASDVEFTPPVMPSKEKKGQKRKTSPNFSPDQSSCVESDLRLTSDDESDNLSTSELPSPESTSSTSTKPPEPTPNKPNIQSKKKGKKSKGLSSDDKAKTEDTGFLSELLHDQDHLLKSKSDSSPVKEARRDQDSQVGENTTPKTSRKFSNFPWSDTVHTSWENYKIKNCPSKKGINVHYQLFSFEATDAGPVKDEKKEPVRVLIRHSIHGITNYNNASENPDEKSVSSTEKRAFVVYPKVENQVFFGCEVNSRSEIVQQWSALVVRPNTNLLQLRICVDSGSVVMTDDRTLESVLKEGNQNHINFKPQSVFTIFDVLFNSLFRMSSGNYLLHHSPKTEAFMKLYKAVEAQGLIHQQSLHLHDVFKEESPVSFEYSASPWLAIDSHILTPFHLTHKKIPATFPMELNRRLNRKERKWKNEKSSKKLSLDF